MGPHTAYQPQMKHHRVRRIVHRVHFNQAPCPPPMSQIHEDEKHIPPRKCFFTKFYFLCNNRNNFYLTVDDDAIIMIFSHFNCYDEEKLGLDRIFFVFVLQKLSFFFSFFTGKQIDTKLAHTNAIHILKYDGKISFVEALKMLLSRIKLHGRCFQNIQSMWV